MANMIPPRVPFEAIDPLALNPGAGRKDTLPAALANIGAVIAAEHLRSQGHRGIHMVALIVLAASANRDRSASELLKLIELEREAWPDDLGGDGWELAKALCAVFASPPDLSHLDNAGLLPGYFSVRCIMEAYKEAVDSLKKADSLDSFSLSREGVSMAVGHAFRVLPMVPEHMAFARAMVDRVHAFLSSEEDEMTLEEAWWFARQPFMIPSHEVRVGEAAAPEKVKARRMANGMGGMVAPLRSRIETHRALFQDLVRPNKNPVRRRMERAGVVAVMRGDLSQVYCSTFMRKAAYDQFLTDGVYRDVWARGPSWHTRYHDRPLVARSFSEMRAFGERGDGITYGYITTCDEWQDEVIESAVSGYGEVEVYWKPDRVLPFATATLEDSMRSGVMIDPADPLSLAYLTLACMPGAEWAGNDPTMAALLPRLQALQGMRGRFIEFQCHGPLTPEDIESVVTHQPDQTDNEPTDPNSRD